MRATWHFAGLAVISLGAVQFGGCSVCQQADAPGEMFQKVKVGMLRAEVDARLGPPVQVSSSAPVWNTAPVPFAVFVEAWYLPPPELGPVDSPYAPGTIGVTFTADGKVVSKRLNPQYRGADAAPARSPR